MQKFTVVLVQILIFMLSGGCMNYPEIVEAKDVRFFEIKEINAAGTRTLKLKGLVFHSALAVETVDISQAGDAVRVMVKLTPAKKGLSGSFEVEVPLTLQDSRVLFGPSEVQIWPISH